MLHKIQLITIFSFLSLAEINAPELRFNTITGDLGIVCEITDEDVSKLNLCLPDNSSVIVIHEFIKIFNLSIPPETLEDWMEYNALLMKGPAGFITVIKRSQNLFLRGCILSGTMFTFDVQSPCYSEGFSVSLCVSEDGIWNLWSNRPIKRPSEPISTCPEFDTELPLSLALANTHDNTLRGRPLFEIRKDPKCTTLTCEVLNRLISNLAIQISDSEKRCEKVCKFLLFNNPVFRMDEQKKNALYLESTKYAYFAKSISDGLIVSQSLFFTVFKLDPSAKDKIDIFKNGDIFTIHLKPLETRFSIDKVWHSFEDHELKFNIKITDPVLGILEIGTGPDEPISTMSTPHFFGPRLLEQDSLENTIVYLRDFLTITNPAYGINEICLYTRQKILGNHYIFRTWDMIWFKLNDQEKFAKSFEDIQKLRTPPFLTIQPVFDSAEFWGARR